MTVADLDRLAGLLADRPWCVLTGAGMSTDSGIPDYRGPDGTRRVTPVTYHDFVRSPAVRARYWARAYAGWHRFRGARPNAAHRAVAWLEDAGVASAVITQNVDRLHQDAGSQHVVDLHGTLQRTVCLECGARAHRDDVHATIEHLNPSFARIAEDAARGRARPDGDVDLPAAALEGFVAPSCPACGADALKPDVVFFGESVPKPRVERCFALVDAARGLLVLGSSLTVFSGYRFVRHAAARGVPVAIITRGTTRGHADAALTLDAGLSDALPALVARLGGPP